MKSFYVALYKARLKNEIIQETQIVAIVKIFQKLEKNAKVDFREDLSLSYLIVFQWKSTFFFLLSGNIIILSGWSLKIKNILKYYINKVGTFDLTDSTYLLKENSRRLRSLGGGLRRILLSIKEMEESITNSEIIKKLKYDIILGNKELLESTFFAIERNSKNYYKVEQKITKEG